MTRILKKTSRITAGMMAGLFGFNMLYMPVSYAQVPFLPAAGTMVDMTAEFNPVAIRGVQLYPDNPFKFDFIVDTGDSELSQEEIKADGQKLIGYFLASLTTPEKEMWVNLSPYEKSRIIPTAFGDTEMGKELLSQDYLLKQIMATALYPERRLGRQFWQKIYNEAQTKFGTTNVPVNTFNKVWILPDKATVYENSRTNSVFVVESSLKVMLEQDYLAANKQKAIEQYGLTNVPPGNTNELSALSSRIIKEIVIPALQKEVNEGKNFAPLRQVYQSLILAAWYKNNLKDNVIAKGYVNRNKTKGVEVADKEITQKIYKQYLQAYRKGVYNYIKEDIDPTTQNMIPRKYFSGGETFEGIGALVQRTTDAAMVGTLIEKGRNHWLRMRAEVETAGAGQSVPLAEKVQADVDATNHRLQEIWGFLGDKRIEIKKMKNDIDAILQEPLPEGLLDDQGEEITPLYVKQTRGALDRLGAEIVEILQSIDSIGAEGLARRSQDMELVNNTVTVWEQKLEQVKAVLAKIKTPLVTAMPAEVKPDKELVKAQRLVYEAESDYENIVRALAAARQEDAKGRLRKAEQVVLNLWVERYQALLDMTGAQQEIPANTEVPAWSLEASMAELIATSVLGQVRQDITAEVSGINPEVELANARQAWTQAKERWDETQKEAGAAYDTYRSEAKKLRKGQQTAEGRALNSLQEAKERANAAVTEAFLQLAQRENEYKALLISKYRTNVTDVLVALYKDLQQSYSSRAEAIFIEFAAEIIKEHWELSKLIKEIDKNAQLPQDSFAGVFKAYAKKNLSDTDVLQAFLEDIKNKIEALAPRADQKTIIGAVDAVARGAVSLPFVDLKALEETIRMMSPVQATTVSLFSLTSQQEIERFERQAISKIGDLDRIIQEIQYKPQYSRNVYNTNMENHIIPNTYTYDQYMNSLNNLLATLKAQINEVSGKLIEARQAVTEGEGKSDNERLVISQAAAAAQNEFDGFRQNFESRDFQQSLQDNKDFLESLLEPIPAFLRQSIPQEKNKSPQQIVTKMVTKMKYVAKPKYRPSQTLPNIYSTYVTNFVYALLLGAVVVAFNPAAANTVSSAVNTVQGLYSDIFGSGTVQPTPARGSIEVETAIQPVIVKTVKITPSVITPASIDRQVPVDLNAGGSPLISDFGLQHDIMDLLKVDAHKAFEMINNGQVMVTANGHRFTAKWNRNSYPAGATFSVGSQVRPAAAAPLKRAVPFVTHRTVVRKPAIVPAPATLKTYYIPPTSEAIPDAISKAVGVKFSPAQIKYMFGHHYITDLGGHPYSSMGKVSSSSGFQVSWPVTSYSGQIRGRLTPHGRIIVDHSMTAARKGGIDLEKVNVNAQGSGVRTAFSDPEQLKMLLKADGLVPVIYKIQPLTVPMMNTLLGISSP